MAGKVFIFGKYKKKNSSSQIKFNGREPNPERNLSCVRTNEWDYETEKKLLMQINLQTKKNDSWEKEQRIDLWVFFLFLLVRISITNPSVCQ